MNDALSGVLGSDAVQSAAEAQSSLTKFVNSLSLTRILTAVVLLLVCAALIRLSALFNSSCRGKIVITRPALQHLPLASPVYTGGAAEYRFAAFFVEFLVLLAVSAALLRFYFSRRSIEMRGRESSDGHTARMLLLLFSAVEFIFDSTRYDSSFMHLNGFVSIVQVFSAASMLALLIYYSRMSVRVSGRSGRRAGLWIGWGVSLVCAALAEYLVQRHGDWYGRCYVPHACMHCENAPCVEICPTGATYTREDGIVAVDYEKCISCQACVSACPYGARKVSPGTGWLFDAAEPAPYEAYGEQRGAVVEKCAFCAHRVDEGKKPVCVVNCPGKARYFGDLDDPESDVSVFLAAHPECEQIGLSGLYYRTVDGMPEGAIDQIVSA